MRKILFMLISALILISSGFSLEEAERRYEEKVSKKANEIRNLPFDKLLEIFRNPNEEYYVRNAALKVLTEYKKKEIINDIIKIKEEEKGKCMAFPLAVHEFRPVCVFESELAKAIVEIELSDLPLKEKINKWMTYQKKGYEIWRKCEEINKNNIDSCYRNSPDYQSISNFDGGSSILLFETKYDKELIKEVLKYRDDENEYLRGLVLDIMRKNIDLIKLEDLTSFLEDSYWGNRIRAIKAMEKLGDKRAIPYLKKILENNKEHEKVRQAAEKAIEKINK